MADESTKSPTERRTAPRRDDDRSQLGMEEWRQAIEKLLGRMARSERAQEKRLFAVEGGITHITQQVGGIDTILREKMPLSTEGVAWVEEARTQIPIPTLTAIYAMFLRIEAAEHRRLDQARHATRTGKDLLIVLMGGMAGLITIMLGTVAFQQHAISSTMLIGISCLIFIGMVLAFVWASTRERRLTLQLEKGHQP